MLTKFNGSCPHMIGFLGSNVIDADHHAVLAGHGTLR